MQTVRGRRSYKKSMWGNLAQYKASTLGIHSNGFWKKNKKELPAYPPARCGATKRFGAISRGVLGVVWNADNQAAF
jgi:hypothetical protein